MTFKGPRIPKARATFAGTLSGVDANGLQPGTYTVQVINTSLTAQPVTVSVARTVRVQ